LNQSEIVIRGNKADGPLQTMPLVNGRRVRKTDGWLVIYECEDGDTFCKMIQERYSDTGRVRPVSCIMRDECKTTESMNRAMCDGLRVVRIELMQRCLIVNEYKFPIIALRGKTARNFDNVA